MPEDEHKISIRTAGCGDHNCEDCGGKDSIIEGTVEEVIKAVYDLGFQRDEFLMEHIIVHQASLMALLSRVEALEGAQQKQSNGIDFGFGTGKMN